jgi:hypothetical protein
MMTGRFGLGNRNGRFKLGDPGDAMALAVGLINNIIAGVVYAARRPAAFTKFRRDSFSPDWSIGP